MAKKINKKLGIICCVLLLISALFSCNSIKNAVYQNTVQTEHTRENFDSFITRLFQNEVVSNTINLHYTLEHPENYGIKEYPITFGSLSEKSLQAMSYTTEANIDFLESLKPDQLTKKQRLTYDILYDYYTTEQKYADLTYYSEILSPTTGTQAQLPILLAEYTFLSEQDVVDYLSLLSTMDTYYTSIMDFESRKAEKGLFMCNAVADEIIAQCQDFISDTDNNFLMEIFNEKIDAADFLSESAKSNYKLQNKSILMSHVIPAYNILIDGLTKLKNSGKNSRGLCYYEDGAEYYEYLVKMSTGSSRTITELKNLLADNMKQDLTKMSELVARDPGILTAVDTYSFAMTDPRVILEDLKTKIAADFPVPPKAEYEVKYVHDSLAPHLSPAFYLTPPIDNIRSNSIYINPDSHYSKIDLYTTLAHEGYPGHLYQNIYFNTNDIDPIRKLISYGGYTEGWATYVEMYSYRLADMEPDVASLLQLNNAVTLCLYANMDIGIHYGGWSLEDVAAYLSKFGFEDKNTAREIYLAILSEPANYLKYCIGYLEFDSLRKTAEASLGKDFSLKEFHKFILDTGPAPFSIIEAYMKEWIKSLG